MFWEKCNRCHREILGFDLKRNEDGTWTCNGKAEAGCLMYAAIHPETKPVLVEKKPELHPLQKEFGFFHPEDGSEDRYFERAQKVPWISHIGWWWVHNLIAHLLIGVAPVKPFFQFHDWTSRKMHGK